MKPEPYWRNQIKVFRNGRLEWYDQPASEQFWADTWTERLHSGYYEQADRGDFQDIEDVLIRFLKLDGLHLEAGCGLGYWVAALKARGFLVEGIEYSQPLVEMLQKARPDLPVRQGNALAIDRPSNSYDSYLSFGVVEHRQTGPEPFLAEAFRVLKPGGVMVISVPFLSPLRQGKARLGLYQKEQSNTEFFQYAFSEQEFCQFLIEAGFRVQEVHYQHVRRCLTEEIQLFFYLNRIRGARYWTRIMQLFFSPKKAGHMLLCIACKGAS